MGKLDSARSGSELYASDHEELVEKLRLNQEHHLIWNSINSKPFGIFIGVNDRHAESPSSSSLRIYQMEVEEEFSNNEIATISATKYIVSDYINHHLTRNGFEWSTCPELRPPNAVNQTMRVLGDEFEMRYKDVFTEMSTQLHITPSSAYPTFMGVTDELFSEGVQWGRIVALFAFGGSLASQAMNKEMPHLVDSIVEWVTTYVDNNLIQWIDQNGTWDGLVEYYDMDVIPVQRDTTWPTLRNFFCGVAAGAIGVLTIGAILTSRS